MFTIEREEGEVVGVKLHNSPLDECGSCFGMDESLYKNLRISDLPADVSFALYKNIGPTVIETFEYELILTKTEEGNLRVLIEDSINAKYDGRPINARIFYPALVKTIEKDPAVQLEGHDFDDPNCFYVRYSITFEENLLINEVVTRTQQLYADLEQKTMVRCIRTLQQQYLNGLN